MLKTKIYQVLFKKSWGACWYVLHNISFNIIYFLQLHLLTGVKALYLIPKEFCLYLFLLSCFVYRYIHIIYIYNVYNIYIYISFDICYILIEKQVELLKTNINDNISQGFQKKNQFSKTCRTRNDIFLLMFWDCVLKFKYFPPNTHHFFLSIVSHDLLCFAGNKNWYVCFDANISCKLIFGDSNLTGLPFRRNTKSF